MAEILTCPACQRKLQVPESCFGQSVQCPECLNTFVADPHAASVQSTPPLLQPGAGAGSPALKGALRRREEDDDDYRHTIPIRRGGIPHRGGMILALGIVALILLPCTTIVCGPLAWMMGSSDLAEIRAGRMEKDGEGMTQAGRILGIISTLLMLVEFVFFCILFLVLVARS